MVSILSFQGGCMQRDDIPIPKEGDVVTWKFNNELVIKARLGQRREHIVDTDCPSCERDFYRPEYELYLGQFAIDYVPEKFEKLTRAEVESMPMTPHKGQIEFNLRLNGAEFKATDRIIHSEKGLDDINQVKVVIEGQGLDFDPQYSTKDGYEKYKKSPEFMSTKVTHEFGLECFTNTKSNKWCFGESSNKNITGVSIVFYKALGPHGKSWEAIYGGIRVRWRIDNNNLKHWKKIDAAIWHLLEAWNVSPIKSNQKISNKLEEKR